MEDNVSPLLDHIIKHGAGAGIAVANEIRRRIRLILLHGYPLWETIRQIRRVLAVHEPMLARTMTDSLLAAWLSGGKEAARRLPEPTLTFGYPSEAKKEPPLPPAIEEAAEGEGEPLVRYPIIEEAANDLRRKQVYRAADFKLLSQEAQRSGFTVARVSSLDALEKIQDALVQDIQQGGTLRQFAERVDEIVDGSPLSDWHVENIYRTNIAKAYSAGLIDVLKSPYVSDEHPYLLYSATHDSRVRPEHLLMETLGLNGTAVYRRDDPSINRLIPPWAWSCRCVIIPLSIEQAAAYGVREAQEWLRTGVPPVHPEFVPTIPFNPPPGFVTAGRMPAIV